MDFKRNNPFLGSYLGFWPSEIRFFNGNGGDSEGGLNGADLGMDLGGGFGAQVGGAMGTGGVLGGEAPGGAPEVQGPDGLFDINLSAYSPAPDVFLEPSIPSTMDDVSKAFSPPSPAFIEFEEGRTGLPLSSEWPSESRFVSTWQGIVREVENTLQGMIEARPGQIKDIKKAVDAIIYGLLGVIGIAQPEAAPALASIALGKGLIEKVGEKTLGQKIAEAAIPEPTFVSAWERHYGFTSPASPAITASPDSEAKSEGLSEGLFSIPVSQKEPSSYLSTYYGKTGYQPLSMSLFQAKEGGGLMIFPTSGKNIEPEGSSLLKKQGPVIDSKALFFLVGMGALGMVLRKTMK
jgi:hypothetical protein